MTIKVSYRYRGVMFALIMSCCTAFIVSGVIIYLQSGALSNFLQLWGKGFITGWPIVFIAILTRAPLVHRSLDIFFEKS